jgi:hypothetical protein
MGDEYSIVVSTAVTVTVTDDILRIDDNFKRELRIFIYLTKNQKSI